MQKEKSSRSTAIGWAGRRYYVERCSVTSLVSASGTDGEQKQGRGVR